MRTAPVLSPLSPPLSQSNRVGVIQLALLFPPFPNTNIKEAVRRRGRTSELSTWLTIAHPAEIHRLRKACSVRWACWCLIPSPLHHFEPRSPSPTTKKNVESSLGTRASGPDIPFNSTQLTHALYSPSRFFYHITLFNLHTLYNPKSGLFTAYHGASSTLVRSMLPSRLNLLYPFPSILTVAFGNW